MEDKNLKIIDSRILVDEKYGTESIIIKCPRGWLEDVLEIVDSKWDNEHNLFVKAVDYIIDNDIKI